MNVRGIRDFVKRKEVFTFFKTHKADVVLIQEAHILENDYALWRNNWGGPLFFNVGKNDARGVVTLITPSIQNKFHFEETYKDLEGRVLAVTCKEQIELMLINVYAPNADKPGFFTSLFIEMEKSDTVNKIYGGDFNVALSSEDTNGNPDLYPKSREVITTYMQEYNYWDVWHTQHPQVKHYMHVASNRTQSRLDYFLVSGELIGNIVKSKIHPGYKTDHSAISIEWISEELTRGRGLWKFNSSLLKQKEFVDGANDIIDNAIQVYSDNTPDTIWEMIKIRFTDYAQGFSKHAAKQKKENLEKVLQKLDSLHQKYQELPTPETEMEINQTQDIINDHIRTKNAKCHLSCQE